ncbi:MAG: hypothetical protein WBD27_06185 [Pyrinomonadaceae bacterium]
MQRGIITFKQFITLFILFGLSVSMAFGQKKPAQGKSPTCSGAWTGSITFSRTQTLTDTQVTPRVSGRGKDTRKMEMKLDYKASVAVVESPENNGRKFRIWNRNQRRRKRRSKCFDWRKFRWHLHRWRWFAADSG